MLYEAVRNILAYPWRSYVRFRRKTIEMLAAQCRQGTYIWLAPNAKSNHKIVLKYMKTLSWWLVLNAKCKYPARCLTGNFANYNKSSHMIIKKCFCNTELFSESWSPLYIILYYGARGEHINIQTSEINARSAKTHKKTCIPSNIKLGTIFMNHCLQTAVSLVPA